MSKVLALKKPTDAARPSVAEKQDAEAWYRTIVMESDDLCAEIRDVRTVVTAATEAWSAGSESLTSCVGVLDMIDYKLGLIESAAQTIFKSARVPKIQKGGLPCPR